MWHLWLSLCLYFIVSHVVDSRSEYVTEHACATAIVVTDNRSIVVPPNGSPARACKDSPRRLPLAQRRCCCLRRPRRSLPLQSPVRTARCLRLYNALARSDSN